MQKSTSPFFSRAELSLLFANVIPVVGVLFFGWSVFMILVAYWVENIVVGIYNVFKIGRYEVSIKPKSGQWTPPLFLVKSFFIVFFIFHFGMFTLGHGLFLFTVFHNPDIVYEEVFFNGISMFIVLMISHGVSYHQNFLGNKEYKNFSDIAQIYKAPYSRVFVMHLVIIFGALISVKFGEPVYVLLLLILLKVIVDFSAHVREHFSMQGRKKMK